MSQIFDMTEDDSGMVNDILEELNRDAPVLEESQHDAILPQEEHRAPIYNPNPIDMAIGNSVLENERLPSTIEVEYQNNLGTWYRVLRIIRKPLIIMSVAFIIFNPSTISTLSNYLPIFSGGNIFKDQFSTAILSLVVAAVFSGLNAFI
tara:strand:+ start:1014 stop:1460 length:447 start_codon:yes stop_codon:yes gene_type:complete